MRGYETGRAGKCVGTNRSRPLGSQALSNPKLNLNPNPSPNPNPNPNPNPI